MHLSPTPTHYWQFVKGGKWISFPFAGAGKAGWNDFPTCSSILKTIPKKLGNALIANATSLLVEVRNWWFYQLKSNPGRCRRWFTKMLERISKLLTLSKTPLGVFHQSQTVAAQNWNIENLLLSSKISGYKIPMNKFSNKTRSQL